MNTAKRRPRQMPCPCGLGSSYSRCCKPFHTGQEVPVTAEKLMRSRYSAFVNLDVAYLTRTWHTSTRPEELELDPDQRWLGLQILATSGGGLLANTATVEFVAEYRLDGRRERLRELSRFVREQGHWLYVEGDHLSCPD